MLIIDEDCEMCEEPGTEDNPVVYAFDNRQACSLSVHVSCAEEFDYDVPNEDGKNEAQVQADEITELKAQLERISAALGEVGYVLDDEGHLHSFR